METVDEKECEFPGNELDCSKIDRAGRDLAGAMNPAKGRRVVTQGQETLVKLSRGITLKDHQPHVDKEGQEFESIVGNVLAMDGAAFGDPDPPSSATEEETPEAEGAGVPPGNVGGSAGHNAVQ